MHIVRNMFLTASLSLSFGVACLAATVPQSIRPSATNSTATSSANQRSPWEYLVVSFGKTEFSDPVADPTLKQAGESKTLAFSKNGIILGQEAIDTEHNLDTLGKFGWELTSVVGDIGGDQEMLFKRHYDPDQSAKEAAEIAAEGKRIRDEQVADASKATPDDEPVDLDQKETDAAIAQARSADEQKVKAAAGKLQGFSVASVTATSSADAPNASSVIGEVTIDGTATLLKNGNQYRSSEANALAKQVADEIYQSGGLVPTASYATPETDSYTGPVRIEITVSITYKGQSFPVGNARTGGKWPDDTSTSSS